MIVLEAEKKFGRGINLQVEPRGLIRNTKKSCSIMIHSHCKVIHMGTTGVPPMRH